MQRIKVCHVTSVHKRHDIRIFKKECMSLVKNGYEVTLLVNDGLEDEKVDGVRIISAKSEVKNRIARIVTSQSLLKRLSLEIDADIYHFHDPELLPLANYMKRHGKAVIFDFHEDVAEQIKHKTWIPKLIRNAVSMIYSEYEKMSAKNYDGVISVTPKFVDRLSAINKNSFLITNYPIIRKESQSIDFNTNDSVCFAGGITEQWNHTCIINAIEEIEQVKYVLAGNVSDDYLASLKSLNGWSKVEFLGRIPHEEVLNIYSKAFAGMTILSFDTQVGDEGTLGNTKLFEFMEAGLPVICSNSRLWKDIIDKYKCGIAVNPENVEEIKNAICYLKKNPEMAESMGRNGRKAIEDLFNWSTQENELLGLYKQLVSR